MIFFDIEDLTQKMQILSQGTITRQCQTKIVQSHTKGDRGETVRKVKYSSVKIENPLLALYRGTEYFSLARTFRTVRGGQKADFCTQDFNHGCKKA